jgi:RNA-directed DNA polymerase
MPPLLTLHNQARSIAKFSSREKLRHSLLRGWVNYFAIGDAGRCFGFIKAWVEKTARRHLRRARKLPGFGWKRWSRRWLYDALG